MKKTRLKRYAVPYESIERGVVYITAKSAKAALANIGEGDYQDDTREIEYDREGIRELREAGA